MKWVLMIPPGDSEISAPKYHFPFEDPGYYDVEVHGQTAGTIYTPPRSFSYVMEEPQAVYLMDTMLIR